MPHIQLILELLLAIALVVAIARLPYRLPEADGPLILPDEPDPLLVVAGFTAMGLLLLALRRAIGQGR